MCGGLDHDILSRVPSRWSRQYGTANYFVEENLIEGDQWPCDKSLNSYHTNPGYCRAGLAVFVAKPMICTFTVTYLCGDVLSYSMVLNTGITVVTFCIDNLGPSSCQPTIDIAFDDANKQITVVNLLKSSNTGRLEVEKNKTVHDCC